MFPNTFFLRVRCSGRGHSFLKHNEIFTRFPQQNRQFRSPIKPEIFKKSSEEPVINRNLLKPTLFTVVFSSASLVGATLWQYENMRVRARTLISSPKSWIMNKIDPSNLWLQEKIGLPASRKKGVVRQFVNNWWNSLSEGEKLFFPIAFLNLLVFLGWKIPSLQKYMFRYFASSPVKGASVWSMFLSTFSHSSGMHLVVNMFVLNSFIPTTVSSLGKEQFLALYCSGGVFASLCSYIMKVVSCQLSLSLGASGAIMTVFGYVCTKYPDTLLSIVFLPFIVFTAGTGLKCLMLMDLSGLVLRWKLFDHAAHLGGATFGIFWCHWGNSYIWQKRGPLLEWWHTKRNPPQ